MLKKVEMQPLTISEASIDQIDKMAQYLTRLNNNNYTAQREVMD